MLALAVTTAVVYLRTFGAGFLSFDDNIHVYANPFLNPLSFDGIGTLWHHAYEWLYIPLAYTILAGVALFAQTPEQLDSSVVHSLTVSPGPFHFTSVGFHIANVLLCFLLAQRLSRSRTSALLCALIFAVHPLQVESVGWISELRGLTSGFFALVALNVFVLSRQVDGNAPKTSRTLLAASAVFVTCSMLCKPAAVVLPLVALTIDRVTLRTPWRKSIVNASIWGVCVLPFALITRSLQNIAPEGMSVWWQRPFIAGDALAFYLFKTFAPTNLCVDYGHTPYSAMLHGWSYVVWAVPVILLVLGYVNRRRRPIMWLGSLLFVAFLLPTLGLTPFKYQAHSTVADRYAYLPMIGVGLVIADAVTAIRSKIALWAVSAAIICLAFTSFKQSSYWVDNTEFLSHTIDVNPNAVFAQLDLGTLLLKEKQVGDAIEHLSKAVELAPRNAEAQNNLGLALFKQGRLDEAEPHYRKAVELNPRYFKAYENLSVVYLQTKRPDAAIAALKAALQLQPSEAKALNDLGVAYMQTGQAAEGLDAFQRAFGIEPSNVRYKKNVGYALMQQGRAQEAAEYLNP